MSLSRKILNAQILLVSCVALLLNGCVENGNGQQLGIVTGINKTGIFFKTYKVFFQTGIDASKSQKYCSENKEIIEKIKELSISQKRITIYYHSEAIMAPWRCDGEENIIDSIKVNENDT